MILYVFQKGDIYTRNNKTKCFVSEMIRSFSGKT